MTLNRPDPKPRGEDRVAIPMDPVGALRALLAVDPDAEPAEAADRDALPAKTRGKHTEQPRK